MSLNPSAALNRVREWNWSLADWKYDPASSRRDLRLDLLRGLFLCFMLLFHYHRSWMIRFSYEFWGTVTAAEGFVFISGMVVCLVYLPLYQQKGFRAMTRKAWGRALSIYLATVVLITAFVLFDRFVMPLRPLNQAPTVPPLEMAFDIVALRYLPFGFDILLLYSLLLLLTPAILWFMQTGRTLWLIALSVALYLLYYLSPATFEWQFVGKEIWRFPVMVWQVLYVSAILVVAYRPQLKAFWYRLPHRSPQIVVVVLFVCFFVLRQMLTAGIWGIEQPTYDLLFSKPVLGPGRLLNFAVLGLVIYWVVDHFWQPLYALPGKLLIPLGQAALYVYLVHLVMVYLYRSGVAQALPYPRSGIYEILSILLLWFLVRKRFLFSLVPH